jgi:hypothetical protein
MLANIHQLVIAGVSFVLIIWFIDNIFIRAGVALYIIYLVWNWMQTNSETFISTRPDIGPAGTAGFNGFFAEPAKFINFDLTEKPRGNNGPYPMYDWWKHHYRQQLRNQYRDCDQYRCQKNDLIVKPKSEDNWSQYQTVADLNFGNDCGYYENPIEFCNRYPYYELCPNNWLTSDHPVRNQRQCGTEVIPDA